MDIVVPASVANLGCGFDTLAVAVQLYLRVRIVDIRDDGGARLTVISSTPPVRGQNAVERAFASVAGRSAVPVPTVIAEVESDIPMAAGLGSSAAAAVAGLRIFERVTAPLSEPALVRAATALEGHADNAAAALFGGLTSVVELDAGDPAVLRWDWPAELKLVVATPDSGLSTAKARAALPVTLSRRDAVFNLQRVLSLVHALERREYGRLRQAVEDRWHQSARMALIPELSSVLALDDPDILGAFLSGAGPSVAILARQHIDRIERLLESTYQRAGRSVTVRTMGVHDSSSGVPDVVASAHGRTV